MARQIQGKIKGLKTDQFKKQPVIIDDEEKPEKTPEKENEEGKKPDSDDAGSEEGKKETTEGEPGPA